MYLCFRIILLIFITETAGGDLDSIGIVKGWKKLFEISQIFCCAYRTLLCGFYFVVCAPVFPDALIDFGRST